MSTISTKPADVEKKWILIDAKDLAAGPVCRILPADSVP